MARAGSGGMRPHTRWTVIAALLLALTVCAHGQGAQNASRSLDDEFLCPAVPGAVKLPVLKTEHTIRSSKPAFDTDVTLVTQLSFERLYMLEGQCDVWTGTISAAVYIALVGGRAVSVDLNSNQDPRLVPLDRVVTAFKQFATAAEARGLCRLDLVLISQEVESVWLSGLYPVNSMRNRALAGARTDVVLLLDVDFWPSVELGDLMASPRRYASLRAAAMGGAAIVLPAFEPSEAGAIGVEMAREAVLEGKLGAATAARDGRLKPFHTDRYRAGHRATDYARWLAAAAPYRIRYEEGYEPYVLVARARVPWYDERFVGYRKNKVVHLLHLASMGARFMAHPRAFAVHSPHPRARTWKVTRQTGLWDQLATIYLDVKRGIGAGTYVPAAAYACAPHLIGPLMPSLPSVGTGAGDAAAVGVVAGTTATPAAVGAAVDDTAAEDAAAAEGLGMGDGAAAGATAAAATAGQGIVAVEATAEVAAKAASATSTSTAAGTATS